MPAVGDVAEAQVQGCGARVHGIHQELRQIEEGMMSIELRAEWARRVDVDLIFDDRSAVGALDLPSALVEFAYGESLPARSFARIQFTYWEKSRT